MSEREQFQSAGEALNAEGDSNADVVPPRVPLQEELLGGRPEFRGTEKPQDSTDRIRCPLCYELIAVSGTDDERQVTCSACGSSFNLLFTKSTIAWEGAGTRVLGRFELVEQLGAGKFGTVWKARDPKLDRTVAVKIPRREDLSPSDEELFFREARATAQLKHPNLVSVHEVSNEGGKICIVCDYIDGVSLQEWLASKRMTPREASELIVKIARALDHAHEQGVVHRDLKPANILLDRRGEPYVADFGLARRESGEVTMTVDGHILGTPAYMPPEQARGEGHAADRRSDVYALGVILFELLTGELPFRGGRRMMLMQILTEDPPRPRKLESHVPRDLETICLKCLEKDPARRYETAADLAGDLDRWLTGRPILARPVGRIATLWRWAKRNPLVAALSGLVAALLLVLGIAGPFVALQQATLRHEADEQTETTRVALDREEEARQRSQRIASEHAMEIGRMRCDAGHADVGLLYFAQAMSSRPAGRDAFEFEIRANLGMWRRRMLSLRSAFAHKSQIATIRFSPDSRALLTASLDRTARLWDPQTGEPLGPPLVHPHQVESADLSIDGKTAITGCFDGSVRLWNARNGKELGPPIKLGSLVREVRYSPDGRSAVARDNSAKAYRLLDLGTDKQRAEPLDHPKVTCFAVSRDGAMIATGGYDGAARLWEAATGKPIGTPMKLGRVSLLAFSPDGKTLAIGGSVVFLIDLATRRPYERPFGHRSLREMTFSSDGRRLATAGNDRRCIVWRVADAGRVLNPDGKSGRPKLQVLPPKSALTTLMHKNQVAHAVFSPDGHLVATSSGKVARLWDAVTGEPLSQPIRDAGRIAISPDGRMLTAASYDGPVRNWELDGGGSPVRLLPHKGLIIDAAFSNDGRRVVTAGQDKTARVWNAATGEPIGGPLKHDGIVAAAAFDREGERLATGSWDGTVRLWQAGTGKAIGEPIRPDKQSVHVVAFSPDGTLLASGGNDKLVRFWDPRTGKASGATLDNRSTVRAMEFSPDGKSLLTGSWAGAAHLWNVETRTLSARLEHPATGRMRTSVSTVAFSPDGKRVVTGGSDKTARLWDAATGKRIHTIQHNATVSRVAFSGDGKLVLSASWDRTVRISDARTGRPLDRARRFLPTSGLGHEDSVPMAALSPDGRLLLTGSQDHTARLWSVATGRPIGPAIEHNGDVAVVAFSPDGRTALTASGAARLIPVAVMPGTPEQIARWVEVASGMALTPDGARFLPVDEWRKRRDALRKSFQPFPARGSEPLENLRNHKHREPGPFGRSYISGS